MLISWCRKALAQQLESSLTEGAGRIVISENGKVLISAGSGEEIGEIDIRDSRAYVAFIRGNTASGESYMAGEWESPDLPQLLRVVGRNLRTYNSTVDVGWRKSMTRMAAQLSFFGRESRRKAKENIARHYDLGNDMFSLFLDDERVYSCAIYPTEDASLDEAQRNKLDRLCVKCGVSEGDRMLDLGCGWGGLSVWAARNYGADVVAVTLSESQFQFMTDRVKKEGLVGKVKPVLSDYRDLDPGGGFDRVISVEMIEAVGPHNFGKYFSRVREMLREGGRAVIQAITVPEERFEEALYDIDFIKEYIFPGGACPSLSAMAEHANNSGMVTGAIDDITEHYVKTLEEWRGRFVANMEKIVSLGYDRGFCRMMSYYFAYCEAGFATRCIEDVQVEYNLPS